MRGGLVGAGGGRTSSSAVFAAAVLLAAIACARPAFSVALLASLRHE